MSNTNLYHCYYERYIISNQPLVSNPCGTKILCGKILMLANYEHQWIFWLNKKYWFLAFDYYNLNSMDKMSLCNYYMYFEIYDLKWCYILLENSYPISVNVHILAICFTGICGSYCLPYVINLILLYLK